MIMTKAHRRAVIKHWRERMMQWDADRELIFAGLKMGIGLVEPEGPLHTLLCEQQDQYTKAVAELVGDRDGWLNWYAHDNDYGRKGFEARARQCDKLRPLRTVAQLARLIEVSE